MSSKTKCIFSNTSLYWCILVTLFACSMLITFRSISGQNAQQQNKVMFRNNEIEFNDLKVIPFEYREIMKQQNDVFLYTSLPDSVLVRDRATGVVTGKEKVMTKRVATKLNKQPIYGNESDFVLSAFESDYSSPTLAQANTDLDHYLFTKMQSSINKLEDGHYAFRLNNLVIDMEGHIAYYEQPGIEIAMGPDEKQPIITNEIKSELTKQITSLLDSPLQFKPALKNGRAVNVRLTLGSYEIRVKNHNAQITERSGC